MFKFWITLNNKWIWIRNMQCRYITYIFISFSLVLNSHLLLSFTHTHTRTHHVFVAFSMVLIENTLKVERQRMPIQMQLLFYQLPTLFAWCLYISLYVPLWMNFLYMRWNCSGLLLNSLCVCVHLCCCCCYYFVCGFHEWTECYGKANAQRWCDNK